MKTALSPHLLAGFIALALSMSCPHVGQAQASFDCNTAMRKVDRLICTWTPLPSLDEKLAQRYRTALKAMPDQVSRTALRDAQRGWLKARDQSCVAQLTDAQARDDKSPALKSALRCLEAAYRDRIIVLQDAVTPAIVPLHVETANTEALDAAYPDKHLRDKYSPWEYARFSSDATLLALGVSQIRTGDVDQVWLYVPDLRRMFPVTPAPPATREHGGIDVAGVENIKWQGDALYSRVRRFNGDTLVYTATRDGPGGTTNAMPRATPPVNPSVDLADTYDIPDPDNVQLSMGNQNYVVWLHNRGHGYFDLNVGKRDHSQATLAHGGWELISLQFDTASSHVLYPTDTGIVRHDLATGTIRRIAGTRRGDHPLDLNAQTQRLSWSRRGTCNASGSDTANIGQRWNVCIAQLPRSSGAPPAQ